MLRYSLRNGNAEESEMRRSSRIAAVVEVTGKKNDIEKRSSRKKAIQSETSSEDEDEEYTRALPKRGSKVGGRKKNKQKQTETRRSGRISAVVNYCEDEKSKREEDESDSSTSGEDDENEEYVRKFPRRKVKGKTGTVNNDTTKKQNPGHRRSSRLSGVEGSDTKSFVELEQRKRKSTKVPSDTLGTKSESSKDVDGKNTDCSTVARDVTDITVTNTRKKKASTDKLKPEPASDAGPTLDTAIDKNHNSDDVSPPTTETTSQDGVQDDSATTSSETTLTASASAVTIANASKQLRSSAAEEEGLLLARSYRKSLQHMEEYSTNFLSEEVNHPVISCFRELTKSDISTILGSAKLRKSLNRLELSYLYIGLIDLLAAVNNNPFYDHNAKFSKNISGSVQKVLLEFKNIIGTWAISGKEVFANRASQIIRYLRTISPMFFKSGFEAEYTLILDSIDAEISRLKSNHEKLKHVGVPSVSTKTTESNPAPLEDEDRGALSEIVLNLNLTPKLDFSDDEDVTVVGEEKQFQIFGKPLKGSSSTSNLKKKSSQKIISWPNATNSPSSSSQTGERGNDQNGEPRTPTASSSKKAPPKRSATEDLKSEAPKKPKLVDLAGSSTSSPVPRNETSIRNFFHSALSAVSATKGSQSEPKVPKPAVNAFALMMNKSREIALKKKADKIGTPAVPALNMNAIKS